MKKDLWYFPVCDTGEIGIITLASEGKFHAYFSTTYSLSHIHKQLFQHLYKLLIRNDIFFFFYMQTEVKRIIIIHINIFFLYAGCP